MSKRRLTIARNLLEAQQSAAMLTTFNEVDMSALMALRERRKEAFKKRHNVSLGIASFFVKASIGALKAFPRLNAEIQHELELMQRGDATLRDQMAKFQRRAQEVLTKPPGGNNNGRR